MNDDRDRSRALDELIDLEGVCAGLAASRVLQGYDVVELAPEDPPPIDLAPALTTALARPTGAAPLRRLAQGARTAAVITSDATRATPSDVLIGPVVDELTRAGVPVEGIDVVIGVGAHRPATSEEIDRLLGREWAARLRVTNHDARAGDLVPMGHTLSGTPLLLNRRVAEADVRIAFGQVEPHEFAGFTGGRKAILPSVSGYESIVRNHSLAMLSAPAARPGMLEGNPIHEEMLAAARAARLDFIVNVALDRESRPVAVAAGDVEEAHLELVGFLRRHFGVPMPERPPAVIITGPGRPLDINLYQSVKPLVAVEPLLDGYGDEGDRVGAGGSAGRGSESRDDSGEPPVVVLLARCWDGAGSDEMFEPFQEARERMDGRGEREAPTPDDFSRAVMTSLADGYTIEKDEAYFVARATPKCRAVIACCPGVPDERLRLLGWEPAVDAETAVARAVEVSRMGSGAGGTDQDKRKLVLVCPRAQRALFV